MTDLKDSDGDLPFNRRANDAIIAELVEQSKEAYRTHLRTRKLSDDIMRMNGDILQIHAHIEEISKTTNQIRDMLATFRTVAVMAKWIAAVAAAVAAVVAAWHSLKP